MIRAAGAGSSIEPAAAAIGASADISGTPSRSAGSEPFPLAGALASGSVACCLEPNLGQRSDMSATLLLSRPVETSRYVSLPDGWQIVLPVAAGGNGGGRTLLRAVAVVGRRRGLPSR